MRIFNSKTRQKEEFVPVTPGKVHMYACGPTVYNYFHIGNARPFIIFDVLRRHLQRQGFDVTFVQNFTDIDDKMINRANEEGITVKELGDRFIEEYHEDAQALGIQPPDVAPRATEHMPDIITLIERLIAKGLAYEVDGDVYFATQAFPNYGELCGQNLDDLEVGARIDVEEQKQNPLDFALWKAQKPGEPAWESPWGMGRPGWHIECSAMSMRYLGESFDIHGGGQDLLFPHHENEKAQSEGATGKPYVRYWMHNGFLNISGEKMSKSAGNFFTVRDIRQQVNPEAVRFFMLSAHYRSPINFSREQLEQAQSALERLYTAKANYAFLAENAPDRPLSAGEEELKQQVEACVADFDRAMNDDLNTADAIGSLFEMVRIANGALKEDSSKAAVALVQQALMDMTGVLGLLGRKEEGPDDAVQQLLAQREAARKAKDWAASDRLRDEIQQLGYAVEDTPQGQKVRQV